MPSRRSPESAEDREARRLVGQRVLQLRAERGLTQDQLSERAGLDRSHVARVEGGILNPSLQTLTRIARGLGVDIRDLFSAD